MKVIEHEGRPKMDFVKLTFNPFIIWLNHRRELRLTPGDKLMNVARIVKQEDWAKDLSMKDVKQMVAFWFALGKRLKRNRLDAPWKKSEFRINPERKYLE
jgi:hypothetical protein